MSTYNWQDGEEIASDKLNLTGVGVLEDTGAANAYTANPQVEDNTGTNDAFSAYARGMTFVLNPDNDNTGASTIDINSLGTQDIKRVGGGELLAGDIVAGTGAVLVYNGTYFELLNPHEPEGTALMTAGEDLESNLAVAIESDGEIYRPRIPDTALDPTYSPANDSGTDNYVSFTKPVYIGGYTDTDGLVKYLILTTTKRSGFDEAVYLLSEFDPTANTLNDIGNSVYKTYTASGGPGASFGLTNNTAVLTAVGSSGAGNPQTVLYLLYNMQSSPSLGSELSLTTTGNAIIGQRYSDTQGLVIFTDGSDLKGTSVSISGTALVQGSETIFSFSTVNFGPTNLERLGDSDYYLLTGRFNVGGGTYSKRVVLIEFDGTTVTERDDVSYSSGFTENNIGLVTMDDETAYIFYPESTNMRARKVTRSGNTITLASEQTISAITTTGGNIVDAYKVTPYQVVLKADSTSNLLVVDIDDNTFTARGTEIGGQADENRICRVADQYMFTARADSSDWYTRIDRWENTLDKYVGITNESITENANGQVATHLFKRGLSGLTSGETYYASVGGEIITAEEGGEVECGIAISSTELKLT